MLYLIFKLLAVSLLDSLYKTKKKWLGDTSSRLNLLVSKVQSDVFWAGKNTLISLKLIIISITI